MAEITFKSAGVKTREIDLSQPRRTGPVGVPAGIIGTALEGPAYVPLTFANYSDFITTFGASDGEKFGPIAVSQWLSNAQAVTYMRVLGAGNGKQRNTSTGKVTNAGFTAGNRIVQENGLIGNNSYAAATDSSGYGPQGRTYFLGTFMSESNGSTIFSDAGIQQLNVKATAVNAIDLTGFTAAGADTTFVYTIPVLAGGSGVATSILLDDGEAADPAEAANKIAIACAATATNSDAKVAGKLILAINGVADGLIDPADSGQGTGTTGIKGITAAQGSSDTQITLTMDNIGVAGNAINALAADALVDLRTFSGGQGGAVPILRGVLLAPSGVILHLSGGTTQNSNAPTKGNIATNSTQGHTTGSVNLATQDFVMLMNGYNNLDTSKLTHITASFDMTSPNYFANVFNTNPYKIEEEGHLLYSHYDIYPDLAVVTGSSVITIGGYSESSNSTAEDIGLLLTSSISTRNEGSSLVPNYEDFEDRFSHAKTPFIISQAFGSAPKDLFRVHLLSPGENTANKFKFSIENIRKANTSNKEYGTFDLVVRSFSDTDEEQRVLESFRGISLNPGSDRYVGRAIGDQNIYYNFDVGSNSQKIIVDGNHPVRSRFIRVEISDDVENGNVDISALPIGFRGPNHLVTSGSLLNASVDALWSTSNIVQALKEPPVPYRETVAQGTGITKKSDQRLFWGVQTTRKTSATQPNLIGLPDNSFKSFTKHFPSHRIDVINFSAGNNAGVADVNGTVLDSDKFNNNKFTLENILVRTGSDTLADPEYWLSASYTRKGNISANETNKTRAFSVDDLGKVGNIKFAKFTFMAQGGFDGVNIFDEEKSKLTNVAVKREMDDALSLGVNDNTVSAYRKAVDIMASKTDVDIQILAIPGLRHASVTDYAVQKVEDRFDAMYIMDIEERDQVNTVITSSIQKPHVSNTVTSFKNRALNSSFAAAYFPDVTVTDPNTNTLIQVPPSVAVLGAYSLNDKVAHPWFAPAGFARGALNSVEVAAVRLNRTNLDDLYEADINPITAFPGTGVTIWGQKTLQSANSALDRINVRRLLINVRRKVKNVANTLLFEPNREETLEKFTALVNPILQRVQEQSGIDRYKAVIDTSTTTQADVENNTIRGKIFLQPTRSVEFVALDFVVTNAGSNI